MSQSPTRFERLAIRLLVVLVVLLITAVVYLLITWPGAGGVFGWGVG